MALRHKVTHWVFLAVVVICCAVPNATGSVRPTLPAPRIEISLNPVSTLFAALTRCRPALAERERWRIAGVVHQESQRYGFDPFFVLALIEIESTCLSTARSRRGAVGLIQVKPSVGRAVAEEAGVRWSGARMLTRPAFNLRLGLRYLANLEKQFHDPYLAMAAYQLGPTRVARMPRHRARRTDYVRKVLARYDALLAYHAAAPRRRAS